MFESGPSKGEFPAIQDVREVTDLHDRKLDRTYVLLKLLTLRLRHIFEWVEVITAIVCLRFVFFSIFVVLLLRLPLRARVALPLVFHLEYLEVVREREQLPLLVVLLIGLRIGPHIKLPDQRLYNQTQDVKEAAHVRALTVEFREEFNEMLDHRIVIASVVAYYMNSLQVHKVRSVSAWRRKTSKFNCAPCY